VERLLKPKSLVPTSVKRLSAPRQTRLNSAAEHFLRQTWPFPEFLFDVYWPSGKTYFANVALLAIITTNFRLITDNLNYL
jgi:hypothetical protein